MSVAQNLSYSVVQVAHNLGAVATVSGSLVALRLHAEVARRKLAKIVLAGWVTQVCSGALLGMISYFYDHAFPDISGIALDALGIKIICATLGILLLVLYLARSKNWSSNSNNKIWLGSALFALTAISSAAFLRWFA